jgi:hypothetical protein
MVVGEATANLTSGLSRSLCPNLKWEERETI